MICSNCGETNAEGSTFCKKCGKRLDGMEVCSACGGLTPVGGTFCVNCGASKSSQPGHFPANFVAETDGAVAAGAEAVAEESGYVFEKYRGLLSKAAVLFAVLTALVGIIFVFLIECNYNVAGYAYDDSSYTLFYFLGDVYDELELILSFSFLTSSQASVLTVGTAFATLCCAAGIIATVISCLVALVRLLRRKSGKSFVAPCAATFLSFVGTVVLFMMCVSRSMSYDGESVAFELGGTAVTGIVLGAIFLVLSVVADAMANLKVGKVRRSVFNWIFALAFTVFAVVILGVLANGVFSYSEEYYSTTYGLYMFFCELAYTSTQLNGSYSDMSTMIIGYGTVLLVFAIVFCLYAPNIIGAALGGRGGALSHKVMKNATAIGIFAIIVGVAMILMTNEYLDYLAYDYYEASLTMPIVIIVFGVLLTAATIVYRCRGKISAFAPYVGE